MRVKTVRFELDDVPRKLACPKCDANVYLQHDGTLLTGDVAHGRETVVRALEKLDELLLEGWRGYFKGVRIVVGGGSIREEVRAQLRHYVGRRIVREYRDESANPGAIVAILRD